MTEHHEGHGGPTRRRFLQAGFVGAALAGPLLQGQAAADETGPDRVPHRPLGKTGERVSALGLGGYTLANAPTREEAVRIAHEAIEAGVTFFDNAWEYHEGKSEEWMGEALKGRRDKVFLMTKVCTHGRDRKVAL
jgi:hypothetical protein